MKVLLTAVIIATTLATAGFTKDATSGSIQTANEVIPKGKFISTIGGGDGFAMTYKGKVYLCFLYDVDEIGCHQNADN